MTIVGRTVTGEGAFILKFNFKLSCNLQWLHILNSTRQRTVTIYKNSKSAFIFFIKDFKICQFICDQHSWLEIQVAAITSEPMSSIWELPFFLAFFLLYMLFGLYVFLFQERILSSRCAAHHAAISGSVTNLSDSRTENFKPPVSLISSVDSPDQNYKLKSKIFKMNLVAQEAPGSCCKPTTASGNVPAVLRQRVH